MCIESNLDVTMRLVPRSSRRYHATGTPLVTAVFCFQWSLLLDSLRRQRLGQDSSQVYDWRRLAEGSAKSKASSWLQSLYSVYGLTRCLLGNIFSRSTACASALRSIRVLGVAVGFPVEPVPRGDSGRGTRAQCLHRHSHWLLVQDCAH